MKKKVLCFVAMFFSIILLTGCNNQGDAIKSIEDTKIEVESIVDEIIDNNSVLNESMTPKYFYSSFLTSTYDLMSNLEQKYKSGDKIYLKFDNEELNGKIIGEDENNRNKYYIYIGNEDDDNLWSYGTVDLTTGNISWENGYQ